MILPSCQFFTFSRLLFVYTTRIYLLRTVCGGYRSKVPVGAGCFGLSGSIDVSTLPRFHLALRTKRFEANSMRSSSPLIGPTSRRSAGKHHVLDFGWCPEYSLRNCQKLAGSTRSSIGGPATEVTIDTYVAVVDLGRH